MKRTSRMIALLLAANMILSMSACGGTSGDSQTASTDTQADSQTASDSDYPKQPIKFIVQYAAGGGVDVTARLVAKYAEKYLGQSIVVENITGGSGVVGQTTLATADPDGYTIGMIFANTAIDSMITEGVTYSLDSFAPICQVNFDPAFLVARAGSEYDVDLDTLVQMTKESQLTMGIGALWQAFDFVKMSLEADYGAPFTRVAYDGGAGACTAVVSGDADVAMVFPNEWMSFYSTGELVGIAVSAPERLEAFPDVPTFAELGYDKIESFGVRRMLVAPAGTDPEILDTLEDAFLQALNDPELIAEFTELGMSVVPADAEEAFANVKAEAEVLGELITGFGIQPGDAPR